MSWRFWRKKPPLKFLGDLVRLEVSPGDVFIVQPSTAISPTTAQALERVWAERFGDDAVLLVLEPGMKIGVLAPAKSAAASAQIQEIEAAASALDDFSGK